MIRTLALFGAAMAMAASTLVATAPEAQAATRSLKIISSNISGDDGEGAGTFEKIRRLGNQVDSFGPDIVLVVEACRTQYDLFMSSHPGWDGTFRTEVTNRTACGGTQELGAFVAAPYALTNKGSNPFPNNSGAALDHSFGMPCADVQVAGFSTVGGVTACAVKMINGSENAGARADMVAALNGHVAGALAVRPVVVGGDLNSLPNSGEMNGMYRLTNGGQMNGPGNFYEGDQTDPSNPGTKPGSVTCASGSGSCRWGEFTHKGGDVNAAPVRKFDYIFFSRQRTAVSSLSLSTFGQPLSGHVGLKATATVTSS